MCPEGFEPPSARPNGVQPGGQNRNLQFYLLPNGIKPGPFKVFGYTLNYEIIFVFKYLLPAEDLKYFSLLIASALVSKLSKYTS